MPEAEDSALVLGVKDTMAGFVRGLAQVTVGHPLDTVKVRLQVQSSSQPRYNGILDCFRKTIQTEGVFGLYKGAASPLSMAAAYSAMLFLAYGQSKRLFHDPRNEYLPAKEMILIGASTAAAASFVEAPMDLLKCKVQNQYGQGMYTGSIDAGRKILKQYGVRGLYQGLDATMLRNIPGTIVYFYTYETLRKFFSKRYNIAPDSLSPSAVLVSGGLAGMVFWITIYPFDVVKSTMQTDASDRSQRKYKNPFHCIKTLYRSEGFLSLWKGFGPCLLRSFPTNAVSFLAYEGARKIIG